MIIIGVIVYSIRPPPVAPEQGDYREMRPTDDPEPVQAALGPHTGVAYHTQKHNTANHTAESTITTNNTNDANHHNHHVVKIPDRQNGTPAIPTDDDEHHRRNPSPGPPPNSAPPRATTPTSRKIANSSPVPHSEQYTRLSVVQDDERLS